MCGIIGYAGFRAVGPVLLDGLKKLEYRGYDSCGVATVDHGKLSIRKDVGKVDAVQAAVALSQASGTAGMAHSRWATHGGVTKENAHPHTDCAGRFAVVHNGIIENFQELKKGLLSRGHRFLSQTDTEVVAHLLEEADGALVDRARQVVSKLHGSFALLFLSSEEPDVLVAARKESPLCVGLGTGENFVASDVMPFLAHTRTAVFLEDGELAVVGKNRVDFLDVSGKPVGKTPTLIAWNAQDAHKGGFDHFMLKEILEQPAAIRSALAQDPIKLDAFLKLVRGARQIKLVACGTSRHAALVGRYLFNRLAGLSAEVYIASEFSYFADQCGPGDLVLCVSQSGETADVLVGLRQAKAKGAKVASLVNVVGSSIDRESDVTLYLNCGPEIAVASTKAFSAQLSVFYMLAYALAGKPEQGVQQLRTVSEQLPGYLEQWQTQTRNLAQRLIAHDHAYFLARGVGFPIALEGALKMKEISYIHAEGMPAGELKHGTLALIETGTPVVLVNPADYTHSETLSNGIETKARGAFLIGLSNQPNDVYDAFVPLPDVPELFYPFVANFPLQLLAYHAAVLRGNDPDKPRNLAKSVTVR